MTGAWHGVALVRFDTDGQRCTTSPPFPATEARAVTDTLLAGIREGQGTIDSGVFLSVLCCLTTAVGSLYQRLIEPHLEWIC